VLRAGRFEAELECPCQFHNWSIRLAYAESKYV
jgi:hypothetical protein